MGITKQMQLEEELTERCEDCVHWNSPERAKMDETTDANTCSKCHEIVYAHSNCSGTNMSYNHFEHNDAD
jgi:hypothetical protein